MIKKTSKAVYRCKSIYRLADVPKQRDKKPLDPEEVRKMWNYCEFVRHAKVLPPARQTHNKFWK